MHLSLGIQYPKDTTFQDPFEGNFDDDPTHPQVPEEHIVLGLSNGITIHHYKSPCIIHYSSYHEKSDPENFYRESLMLFLPWCDEQKD